MSRGEKIDDQINILKDYEQKSEIRKKRARDYKENYDKENKNCHNDNQGKPILKIEKTLYSDDVPSKKHFEGPIYSHRCSDLTFNKPVSPLKNELRNKRARDNNENHDEKKGISFNDYQGEPKVKKGKQEDSDNVDNRKYFDNTIHEKNNSDRTPLFMAIYMGQVMATEYIFEIYD